MPFDLTLALDQYVAAQVARTPDAIALSDARESVTYAQMWRRVNSFEAALQRRGIGRGRIVGLCMTRSVDLAVTLLAILRCGAAYCPLDPDQPPARLRSMIEQADPSALIAAPAFAPLVKEAATNTRCREILALDRLRDPLSGRQAPDAQADRASRRFEPEDVAYVIFTSGSTGQPKGVAVPHRGIVNRLLSMQSDFCLTGRDTVLQKTPYTFDVSVWELFWPLLAGARIFFADPGAHRDPRYLAECISAEGVTTVHFVPSMLSLFLEERRARRCHSLRTVICSGEALSGSVMRRALETLPGASLWNLYGPTEASIDVTGWKCRMQAAAAAVPIGSPAANVRCFVLDDAGERVALGATGELCIGGVQVALGYVNRPELTAERFVASPLSPGALYRTGDLVRWRADGVLEYLGRRDAQVKLHGVRIELGEIEEALRALPEIVDAAVIVRDDVRSAERLVAYVVSRGGVQPQTAALRRALSEALPRNMIPTLIVGMARLPTTGSGKVDRAALPSPASVGLD